MPAPEMPKDSPSRAFSWLPFVVTVVVTFAAAAVGVQFLPGEWYAGLKRPALAPPNWVFGPVWTLLYLMMAIAAGLVWNRAGLAKARFALGAYAVQLALNSVWSILFFGWHSPAIALVDIVLLWLAIVVTLVLFFRQHPLAGWLMIPYLAWVSFATYLNFEFWRLN